MLTLSSAVRDEVLAACLTGYPLEVCGLLGGRVEGGSATATRSWTTRNAAASSRVYTVEPIDLLRADRQAEASGDSVVAVWHSHTHTDAYPSPTDIESAPDPGWWYVLVSLRDVEPSLRAYRIRGGDVEEEPVTVR